MKEYYIESTNFAHFKNDIYLSYQTHESMQIAAPAHIHSSIEIIYIKEGFYTVLLDDVEYKLFAGDVILFRSNAIHHIQTGSAKKNSYYVLTIKPEVIRSLAEPSMAGVYALSFAVNHFSAKSLWTKEELLQTAPEIQSGIDLLIREFYANDDYCDIALKLAAGTILLGMMRSGAAVKNDSLKANRETVDSIYKAVVYINSHYAEDISAGQLCLLAGMSYSFFSRSFKTITGRSFKQYLNTIRVNQAERLLATTDKTISEICSACGYNDVSYFIKVFRECKGMPPGSYKLSKNHM